MNEIDLNIYQNFLTKMFSDLIEILEREKFNYFVISGTLIGVVRHSGFIPWDDDLDIAMPRDDYEKFKEFIKHSPSNKYEFKDAFICDNFPSFHGKFIDKTTTLIQQTKTTLYSGISIDVFPIDKIDSLEKKAKKTLRKIKRLRTMYTIRNNVYNPKKDNIIISHIIRPILLLSTSNHRILNRVTKIITSKKTIESDNYAIYFGSSGTKEIYHKEWVEQSINMKFNNLDVAIPKGYHEILSKTYGEYMILPRQDMRKPKHNLKEIYFEKPYKELVKENHIKNKKSIKY